MPVGIEKYWCQPCAALNWTHSLLETAAGAPEVLIRSVSALILLPKIEQIIWENVVAPFPDSCMGVITEDIAKGGNDSAMHPGRRILQCCYLIQACGEPSRW